MAKEFWYNDNGTWRKTIEFYYNDNGTWRTVKEGWYNDNGTWRQFYSNINGTVSLAGVSDRVAYAAYPATATSNYNFVTNGTFNGLPSISGNWFSPTTTGIGSSYWMRITLLSGSALTTNTCSTWTQMSSNQTVSLSVGPSVFDTKSSNIRIEIASDSGGSTIVATKDITLGAETF